MFTFLFNFWCILWLIIVYLSLFPFILVCIKIKKLNRYGTKLTNFWADVFFVVVGMPVQIEHRFKPDIQKNYVFVANHFSYLDVAVGMKVVRNYFSYMGKSSVKNIPLLGYMFAKLHIQVDRSDKNSRSKSMLRSKKALDSGRSLFIMPEGGIVSQEIPKMHQPFKDGAFLLAIGSGVPIVPITFLNLYEIMPDKTIFWGLPKVVVHEPIETAGFTKENLEELKSEVYRVIQNELNAYKNGN
ncbi:MAG TPA: lysophospholipid acyltransferase family protein [Leadbetterella sp.]|nr:lysophospholipid acyltransferase family protein [Leadbetterella sp.]